MDGWTKFDSFDWSCLLGVQPQFANRCDRVNGWEEFGLMEWRKLLLEQPYLADRCAQVKVCKRFFPDKAKECASGWAAILLENLKLVGEFAEWGYSNKKALCDFLSCNSNSQFIDWCDNANIWTKFDFKEWRKLLLA